MMNEMNSMNISGNADRAQFVKSMHDIIIHLNCEDAYSRWIYLVPDGATDEDFWGIANDEELFDECVYLFEELVKTYLKYGIYIGKTCY